MVPPFSSAVFAVSLFLWRFSLFSSVLLHTQSRAHVSVDSFIIVIHASTMRNLAFRIAASLPLAAVASLAAAQATTTPGAPNTGTVEETILNAVLLVSSALLAAGGALYLILTRKPAVNK
jgi:hypothetical protein